MPPLGKGLGQARFGTNRPFLYRLCGWSFCFVVKHSAKSVGGGSRLNSVDEVDEGHDGLALYVMPVHLRWRKGRVGQVRERGGGGDFIVKQLMQKEKERAREREMP